MSRLILALVLLAAAALPAHAKQTRTYVIVIAVNHSLDPGVPRLQYADDDGAKHWELFSLYAKRTSLFTVLDPDTARLHPGAARVAEVPERDEIVRRLADYNRDMDADIARGDEPELFFIYAGHGDVDAQGQGYITLHDRKLTRAELFREVVAPSRAGFVHVIVDACRSYYMVNARGGKPWVDDTVPEAVDTSTMQLKAFLEEEQLERYPRAGVIVATSGDEETHEWSRYRGGILSHEVRSALSGAADVNGDGRIEYSELTAFVAAANVRIRNANVKLEMFSRAPAADRRRALVDVSRAQGARPLRFDADLQGRYTLEDDRGVRYADFNKAQGTTFDIVVPTQLGYFVRHEDTREATVAGQGTGSLRVSRLPFSTRSVAARGALDETFRKDLFGVAFGRSFYDGYVATSGALSVDVDVAESTPTVATSRGHELAVGYLIGRPSVGQSGGASHGIAARWARARRDALEFGAGVEIGYFAGNRDESLVRLAILPSVAWRRRQGDVTLRADVSAGWQLLHGTVVIDDMKVRGTEPRGLRAELAGGADAEVSPSVVLRVRGGLALDGVYPADVPSSTRLGPFLDAALVLRL